MIGLPGKLIQRRLTVGYIGALAIVGLLTLASHFILLEVLRAQGGSAAVVNMSGRQRMLSQRIASLAAQYEMGDGSVKGDLAAAVTLFETNHETLVHGSAARDIPPATIPALRALYFSPPFLLDMRTRLYIEEARAILARPPADPAARPVVTLLLSQATPLLDGLDHVVTVHQRQSEAVMDRLQRIQEATLAVVLATLVLEALGIFRPLVRRVSRDASQLAVLATFDALTGALNRRSFMERGSAQLAEAREASRPLSLLMIDADHFKQINDTYRHAGGDAVLRALVLAFQRVVRLDDLIGRLGGEEFAILLPGAGLAAASNTAERLRRAVAELAVESEGAVITASISVGIAVLEREDGSLEALMARADRALYEAKARGRNRVEAAA